MLTATRLRRILKNWHSRNIWWPSAKGAVLAIRRKNKANKVEKSVAVEEFTESATVTEITNNQTFKASALWQDAGWFTGGEVAWTSGNNEGRRMEIKEFAETQIVLALAMGKSIQVGDEFDIIAGCARSG